MSQQSLHCLVRIAANHPAAEGHFPGNPLVPGVVLLDEVIAAVRQGYCGFPSVVRIEQAKFHTPVIFGQILDLQVRPRPGNRLEFSLQRDDEVVASGRLGSIAP